MALRSRTKHLLHSFACITCIVIFNIIAGGIRLGRRRFDDVDPIQNYGVILTVILYAVRFLCVLPLPLCVLEFLGLVFYNAFPEKPQLKNSPLLAPLICVRVVTKGDYPDLVKGNLTRNINTCLDVGVGNFLFEVVTDKALNLPNNALVREIVVPSTYTTKTGAKFKARALQYCLEDEVYILSDNDWIVHLDEETLLTDNSVRGIINFVTDGKHDFGQGLITYANENVVNWLTTLSDMYRVATDMGKLRFQFRVFHKPLFGWKGSYVVTRAGAERKVTYDHGSDGSVAEDSFFALMAYRDGYSFDFIEGEMWEKSPFSIWDFLQQRKRWIQGIFLVVHNREIPWQNKFCLAFALCVWMSIPFVSFNWLLNLYFPIPIHQVFDILCGFAGGMSVYMYMFGVIKSFSVYRIGLCKFILFCLGALCTIPFNAMIENTAVIWGLFGNKYTFYVVKKDERPLIVV